MELERPVGEPVEWSPVSRPQRVALRGHHVLVRPLDPVTDADALYAVSHEPDGDPTVWTYLPHGPYRSAGELRATLEAQSRSEDPLYFTLVRLAGGRPDGRSDKRSDERPGGRRSDERPDERPEGIAAYLRITPEFGVIEVGHIMLGLPMQRTIAATEAIYLIARHVFDDLGYRRFEWKCDALNAGSRRAAERFGFEFEGVFRQHMVVKGRNRDTAWFAIVDRDWPGVRAAFEAWLAADNFDPDGRQLRTLAQVRASA
jgi:RimJ/RimL family protein N-acetyltransferase